MPLFYNGKLLNLLYINDPLFTIYIVFLFKKLAAFFNRQLITTSAVLPVGL